MDLATEKPGDCKDYLCAELIVNYCLQMLSYMLRACKPCTCPASRTKKEPVFGDRDIDGLMDGGISYV